MCFMSRLISTFRCANITNQITTKIYEIVRNQSTRVSCKRQSRLDLSNIVIKFGLIRCKTPPRTCGITRKPGKNCWPKIDVSEEAKKCCKTACKWAHPRFDDLYYKPSDKDKRKYQQTWAEFGEIFMYPVRLCCHDKAKHPLPERRKPPIQVPLCSDLRYCKLQMLCRNRLESKCARLTWAGCRDVRFPPTCGIDRKHCGPRKRTPYPSYSECCKDVRPLKVKHQCDCLKIPIDCYY